MIPNDGLKLPGSTLPNVVPQPALNGTPMPSPRPKPQPDQPAVTRAYVEHPAHVAELLSHYVGIVGVERVIAGTDCGFGTFAGIGKVDPAVAYKKLASLVAGAELVTRR